MANEIVQFKGENGAMVTITSDDVRAWLCPEANDKEVFLFLELCKAHRLNPWIGDVYLIKYGDNPAQMQAGKEAFTKRAAANPDFDGIEAGITVFNTKTGRLTQREGSAVYADLGERLVGGWARVHVKSKSHTFYDEVALSEYNTGRGLWKTKPATMIRKVALVHALREAFPDDFAGLYSEEEMPDGPAPKRAKGKPREAAQAAQSVEVKQPPATVDDQNDVAQRMKALAELRGVSNQDVYNGVFGSKALKALGYVEGEMTHEQARAAVKLLDKWILVATKKAAQEKAAQSVEVKQTEQAETLPDMPEYETE
jgi:phage recombination protein Bet